MNRKDDPLEDFENELYSQRLLIFIETEPQSNIYKQLLLTGEEFKKITMNIGTVKGKKGRIDVVEINESDETYVLPDLKQIYETVSV